MKRHFLLVRKAMTNLDSIFKSRHYFANKSPSNQSYGFSSGHVWMWELDYKESWELKNGCFWTVVLEKTLESLLDCKEIKQVNPKGNQSWISIERTHAEAETPIFWPPHAELTHLKRPWCWERLKAGEEGDNRGWDGWMASLTRWTWVWASSRNWWWTGRPGVLQSMQLQRVGHNWATELSSTVRSLSLQTLYDSCCSLRCIFSCWLYRLIHPGTWISACLWKGTSGYIG